METVINLKALMEDLLSRKEHPRVAQALKRVLLYQSCNADLEQASVSLELLNQMMLAPQEAAQHPVIEQSLLMSAIVFYVRATVGSSQDGGRGSAQISDALSPEMQKQHGVIADLRNRAVAHVHVGSTADDWHRQFLALVPHRGGWATTCTSQGVTYNRPIQASLGQLIPKAMEIMADRFHKAVERAAIEFNAVSDQLDAGRFAMPAEQYFGSAELAHQVLGHRDPAASKTMYTR